MKGYLEHETRSKTGVSPVFSIESEDGIHRQKDGSKQSAVSNANEPWFPTVCQNESHCGHIRSNVIGGNARQPWKVTVSTKYGPTEEFLRF